ncbi:MAG TPA: DNA polymerase III subunit gamma/tau [Ktedonobacterales bacterium]|nr:DNA polymerase III subunit gamma/tau [Ktedonobacterales bacterium]
MASQSLYRKWRSQSFSDLVGQEAVVRTLLNAVREGRLAHAYLFCGPRGTGKTSAARLLAKAVNCANPHDGEPCNECISCREITAGTSPDVIEIDAASNNSVDNMRELVGNANLLGGGGKYKMYIVDETHMLSTQAFNALLKTLEEPPPHIIFVLATTEVHKVLPTILSRCQRFNFARFSMRDLTARLRHVAEGEGLDLQPGAAELLARAAQGGMRDALSLLDQAVAFCGTQVDRDGVRRMLGLGDPGLLRTLIAHVADQDTAAGLHLIDELVRGGADLRQLNTQLSDEWRALVLARAGADVAMLLDRSDDDARELAALASRFTLDALTACTRVFARNETPARALPVPQLALELSFLDCVAIQGGRASAQSVDTAARLTLPSSAVAPGGPGQPARATAHGPTSDDGAIAEVRRAAPPRSPSPSPRQTASQREDAPVEELDLDAIARGEAEPAPDIWQAPPATEGASYAPAASAPAATEDVPMPANAPADPDNGYGDQRDLLFGAQEKWALVKKVCKQKSASVAALLHSARPVLVEPGELPVLVLQADHRFHMEQLRDPKRKAAVEWALEQVLETAVRVRIASGPGNPGDSSGGLPAPSGPAGGSPPARHSPSGGANGVAPRGAAPANLGADARVPDSALDARSQRSAPQNGTLRDAAAPYASAPVVMAALPDNVTPIRPQVTVSAPAAAVWALPSGSGRALEDEVRADPVIQALIRTHGIELADVRALDGEDEPQ